MDSPPANPTNHFTGPKLWLLALALAALPLVLFWPAIHYGFINLDDPFYVSRNPHVTTGLSVENIRWAFRTTELHWWLPLLWISFMLDTELFGPGPLGHHLVNILLHALNTGLLFWALARMTRSIGPSALVAAIFAVHPQRVEAVAWITARKDVLSGLFFMLSLLAYLRQVRKPSPRFRWTVTLLMLLGLLSKGILIVLPPLLLLLDFWPLGRAGDPLDRRQWPGWRALLREKWPLFLLAAIFTGLHWHLHTHDTPPGVSFATRLGLIPLNYWAYIGKLLWPHPLSIVYPEHDVAPWGLVMGALAGVLLLTAGAVRWRHRCPAAGVGWLWFLIALLPVIRGVRLGIAAMADRFTYLPSIGLSMAAAWAALALIPPGRWRQWGLTILSLLLVTVCFVLSGAYLAVWKDSETLFRHGIKVTDANYGLYMNLALIYHEQERLADEIAALRRAEAAAPEEAPPHVGLAVAFRRVGQLIEAARHLDWALRRLRAEDISSAKTLAKECALAGRHSEAIRLYEHLLARLPNAMEIRLDLAAAQNLAGQPQAALIHAEDVLRHHPAQARAQYVRGQALLALDRPAEALQAFEEALRWQPAHVDYQLSHAMALAATGRRAEAAARLREGILRNPDSAELHNNLAWLLASDPAAEIFDPAAAVELAVRAVELSRRQDPRLLHTLAVAYAAARQPEMALNICREAQALARAQHNAALLAELQALEQNCLAPALSQTSASTP